MPVNKNFYNTVSPPNNSFIVEIDKCNEDTQKSQNNEAAKKCGIETKSKENQLFSDDSDSYEEFIIALGNAI